MCRSQFWLVQHSRQCTASSEFALEVRHTSGRPISMIPAFSTAFKRLAFYPAPGCAAAASTSGRAAINTTPIFFCHRYSGITPEQPPIPGGRQGMQRDWEFCLKDTMSE